MSALEIPKEVFDFFTDLEEYNINHHFEELQFSRGKISYDKIIKKLADVELPNPMSLTYSTLSKQELTETITETFCKIFGFEYKDKIEEYNKLIRYENFENVFQADLQTDLDSTGQYQQPVNVFISKQCASIQVVSTSHEYVHCLLSKYTTFLFNKVLNNVHYKELLPIVIEYIVCLELSLTLKNENLREKHQIIRIGHDKDQISELLSCRKLKQLLQREMKEKNLQESPIMKYFEYQEHNSYSYILADIYGSYLCNVYQENPKELIEIIKRIFSSEKCINDLISYFNLSLRNSEVIENYNQTINHLSLRKK